MSEEEHVPVTEDRLVEALQAVFLNTSKPSVPNFRFSGDGAGAKEFLQQLEEHSQLHNQSEDHFLRCLPFVLKDTARAWFLEVKDQITTSEEFTTLFLDRFLPTSKDSEIRCKLYQLQQQPNQSAEKFINSVLALNRQLREPIPAADLVPIMLRNLHPSLKLYLTPSLVQSLDALYTETSRIEEVLAQCGPPPAVFGPPSPNPFTQQGYARPQQPRTAVFRPRWEPPTQTFL